MQSGRVVPIAVVLLAVLAATSLAPAVAGTGNYIVALKESLAGNAAIGGTGDARAAVRRHGTLPRFLYQHALHGYAAALDDAALDRVKADPAVAFVAADRRLRIPERSVRALMSADCRFGGFSLPPTQLTPTGILRIDGLQSPTANIDEVDERVDADIAILDTGIAAAHPDLNVVGGVDCVTRSDRNAKYLIDPAGHGTHVSGTAAALDNAYGVVGVAPGARLWAVRVLNRNGVGQLSQILCGVDWVTAHADVIDVANMSLGGPGSDDGNCGNTNNDPFHLAICNSVAAGVTYVVAAGNAADDAANSTPSSYDEVITVSALADYDGQPGGGATPPAECFTESVDDMLAVFSNFGADVDIAGPGSCITSTYSSRKFLFSQPSNGCYAILGGTSMASPHLAGAAALYRATHPSASPAQVKQALLDSAEPGPIAGDPDSSPEGVANVANY